MSEHTKILPRLRTLSLGFQAQLQSSVVPYFIPNQKRSDGVVDRREPVNKQQKTKEEDVHLLLETPGGDLLGVCEKESSMDAK
jgi:hypothetical protein